MKIRGRAVYKDLGLGFWGIEDSNGNQWLPVNMPEQLKTDGARVTCSIIKIEGESMFMWGEPVKIISFNTITP